jgi:hypothetical protein
VSLAVAVVEHTSRKIDGKQLRGLDHVPAVGEEQGKKEVVVGAAKG